LRVAQTPVKETSCVNALTMAASSSGEEVHSFVSHRNILEHAMTDREHDQLLATATDRFERRLSEEAAALRQSDSQTRLEIANLRVDMTGQFAAAQVQSEKRHHELLKWSLVFWVGQVAALTGLFSAII
jgi:hypothetical protein